MSAVRIENDAWSDPRYVTLAKLCGLADRDFALILCARVWSHCTNQKLYVLDAQTIDAITLIDGFADHMATSKLAEPNKKGGYRIKGSKGRIEWLEKLKENGKKGGQRKASNRLASASQSLEQTPGNGLALAKQSSSKDVASYSYSGSSSSSSSGSDSEKQEAEAEKSVATDPAGRVAATPKPRPSAPSAAPTSATWEAYAVAYRARYSADPLRNATVNGQLSRFLSRVPGDEAPHIAEHYVSSNNARYVSAGHAVGCLLQDAEKLRTEWLTGRSSTAHEARATDRTSGRSQAYEQTFAQLRAEDRKATTHG